ncbi:ankyrin repeat-containing domain protein [Halteromyces radiatus]|uniref:ankyrin repeat-containing domain protein n=1 Tax=Halteromyces radiatus TaxID=101107 RepID=UPI00222002F4|nr:ankyrin repeat-containing domain protein [Halteromyces radiatus]KAI8093026.1 ankyrin repeat-containing domain protein [Halteromyces radiatus]
MDPLSSTLPRVKNPSITLISDTTAIKEFYAAASMVKDDQIQKRIHEAMDTITTIWTQRHDDMISTINQLDQSNISLQQEAQVRLAMYNKALRSLHYYKSKYEATAGTNSSTTSDYSCSSKVSFYNAPTDDGHYIPSQPSSYSSSLPPLPLFTSNNMSNKEIANTGQEDDKFDMLSILEFSYSNTIPAAKPPPANSTAINHVTTEELKFACGDGFWSTIATGKSKKEEVDLLVKRYLKRGGKANVANNSGTIKSVKEGYGLIHALIIVRNTSALQRIIEAGVNPHALPLVTDEKDKISPLVLAAQLGYMNGIRLLIERAHVNVLASKGPRQENALLAAIQADAFEIVAYLLRLSRQLLDQADVFGATAVHYASMFGKTRILMFLVREYGQSPDVVDYKGETPLHYAIRNRQAKAVATLVGELAAYLNPYVLKKVQTPLDLAKSGGLRRIVDYLRKAGAKTVKEMEKTATSSSSISSSSGIGTSFVSHSSSISLNSSGYSANSGTSYSQESVNSLNNQSFISGTASSVKNKLEELML